MARERFRRFRQSATCDRCGHSDVAWVKSAKGKWYLAPIVTVDGEDRVDAYRFHSRDCQMFSEERARWAELEATRPEREFRALASDLRDKLVEAYLDGGTRPDEADLEKIASLATSAEQQGEVEKLRALFVRLPE